MLNPKQQIAVEHVEGPLLVLAGPGSGKTRVVTHRIAHLIDLGILPSDILAVTFTNKAADEMKSRIQTLSGVRVLACTFHSLGVRILRESIASLGYRPDFTIYDEEDSEKLLKTCLDQVLTQDKGFLRSLKSKISSAKNDLLDPHDMKDVLTRTSYECYQKKLKDCNALDFDDLLYLTVKLLRENLGIASEYQNRWLFILIDEYQDTNLAQYTLAKILVEKHQNIFAVGDPDQSIYSWRGAKYHNILNFESDFPGAKIVILDQNYRSTNQILNAANALIRRNNERYDKKLWSDLGEGEKIGLFTASNEREEAEFVANQIRTHILSDQITYNDIAIFYRTNAQSRVFEDCLLSRKIPYVIIGGLSFYNRKEIKDLLAYLRMVASDTDLISFLRTVNLPRRGLGVAALEKITAASEQCNLPIFTFCEEIFIRPAIYPDLRLSPKQKEGLKEYVRIIHSLRDKRPSLKIFELISETLSESRYLSYIQEDSETFQDRKENLGALIEKATEWEEEKEDPTLIHFLEELSLRSQMQQNLHYPSVKLMTLHNGKGLEFALVFLTGLEEGIFPHINAQDNATSLEEERRLCYVGMTRAKRYLYLCSAMYRFMWESRRQMHPSRFIEEIPPQFIEEYN
ncbi:MAG TPA: UvrD-helicase domain-containing protein [Chlamydiales bacterium]|nr:UvrD-helicase domain-containing protein [Chlamydiales bacterium]